MAEHHHHHPTPMHNDDNMSVSSYSVQDYRSTAMAEPTMTISEFPVYGDNGCQNDVDSIMSKLSMKEDQTPHDLKNPAKDQPIKPEHLGPLYESDSTPPPKTLISIYDLL
jgi:hypothetical protein